MTFKKKGTYVYLKIEIRSSESQWVENSLWKRLWNCRKTDYILLVVMMMMIMILVVVE